MVEYFNLYINACLNNFIIEGAHSNYDPDLISFSLQS